jgi:hypothetical protein
VVGAVVAGVSAWIAEISGASAAARPPPLPLPVPVPDPLLSPDPPVSPAASYPPSPDPLYPYGDVAAVVDGVVDVEVVLAAVLAA